LFNKAEFADYAVKLKTLSELTKRNSDV